MNNQDTYSVQNIECSFKEKKKLKKNHCQFCFLLRFECDNAKCGLPGKERADKKIGVFTIQETPLKV